MATNRTSSPAADIALIAVFAALIAAFALTPAITIGAAAVPLTLQTLAVVLTGLVLGAWRGFLATLLYVVVGLAGLPVFAGGAAGIGVLAGPTAGYLLSFPLGAAVAGAVAGWCLRRGFRGRYLWLVVAGLACTVVVTAFGIVGMMVNIPWPLDKAFFAALLYLPGDVVKVFAAAGIAVAVHKAFPVLLAVPDPRLA
jgi:biotin transport system substrate-specific component